MPKIIDPDDLLDLTVEEKTITIEVPEEPIFEMCEFGLYVHHNLTEEGESKLPDDWESWPIEKKRAAWDKMCGYE